VERVKKRPYLERRVCCVAQCATDLGGVGGVTVRDSHLWTWYTEFCFNPVGR
jgi:hypothetical protein